MARRHSYRAHEASSTGAMLAEDERAVTIDMTAWEPTSTAPVVRVETVESNPLSGPITVPVRRSLGGTGARPSRSR